MLGITGSSFSSTLLYDPCQITLAPHALRTAFISGYCLSIHLQAHLTSTTGVDVPTRRLHPRDHGEDTRKHLERVASFRAGRSIFLGIHSTAQWIR